MDELLYALLYTTTTMTETQSYACYVNDDTLHLQQHANASPTERTVTIGINQG